MVRADIHLTGEHLDWESLLDYATRADRTSLGAVWLAEGFRDSLLASALVARATERLLVGTNVTQWVRPPGSLEMAAADLAELAGGRFVLGLGTAHPEWNERWHAIRWERPVERMRDYVTTVRALWDAEADRPVSTQGPFFAIEQYIRLGGAAPVRPPVYLGAGRPLMTRLAGEIADGVCFNIGLSEQFVASRLAPELARGQALAGRDRSSVSRGLLVIAAIGEREDALARARRQLAYYAAVTSYCDGTFEHHDAAELLAELKRRASEGRQARRDVRAALDLDALGALIPEDLVDAIALVVSPARAQDALARYEGILDYVALSTPAPGTPPAAVRANHEAILQAFAR
jgi:alkanesulfonate monooxygenase SsuD/methylene tetrahydromethanopterin reductase-like flavin-dependent oxidoreductase (luciferase family)